MDRRTSLLAFLLSAFLLIPGFVLGTPPLRHADPVTDTAPPARENFYCQSPDYGMIYNISSGFDAEIADDIPVEYAGELLGEVTIWLGEWFSLGGPFWRDPLGLRVNFYHESCPPELEPFRSVEISWEDADKTLVHDGAGSKVYELRVPVAPPLLIESGMSLGATALIDWGQEEPFTGICATPFYVSYGNCPAYLDAANWGYHRWTAIDYYTGIVQDLGYCLGGVPTGVVDLPSGESMIRVETNPSYKETAIRLSLARSGEITLRIHDVTGRRVATLHAGRLDAGEHIINWDGRDASCRSVAAGVYLLTLQGADGIRHGKIVRLE